MLKNNDIQKMGNIDWKKIDDNGDECRYETDITKITVRDDEFTIIYQRFSSDDRSYVEGKIVLKKTMNYQTYEGEINYLSGTGEVAVASFKVSGGFSDDNYDEFKGIWQEGKVTYELTISLDY